MSRTYSNAFYYEETRKYYPFYQRVKRARKQRQMPHPDRFLSLLRPKNHTQTAFYPPAAGMYIPHYDFFGEIRA